MNPQEIPASRLLQEVLLPPKIAALSHVVSLLDSFLQTPEEALVKAAATGQESQARRILDKFKCQVPAEAVVAAASHGHMALVFMLLIQYIQENEEAWDVMKAAATAAAVSGYLAVVEYFLPGIVAYGSETRDAEAPRTLREMIVSAARNGHLGVVEKLLPETIGFDQVNGVYDKYEGWREALNESAAAGQLAVVQFLVEHAVAGEYTSRYGDESPDALSRAMTAGQDEVVSFLLLHTKERFAKLEFAFAGAVDRQDQRLADNICEIYRELKGQDSLFLDA